MITRRPIFKLTTKRVTLRQIVNNEQSKAQESNKSKLNLNLKEKLKILVTIKYLIRTHQATKSQ